MNITDNVEGWYRNNQFRLILVTAESGMGKSVYTLKALQELYPKEKRIDYTPGDDPVIDHKQPLWDEYKGSPYNDIRKYILFRPEEVLAFSKYMFRHKMRIPFAVMDDSGIFLSSDQWNSPEVSALTKWLQVARTVCSCVALTTTSAENVVRRVRTLDMYNTKIKLLPRGWRAARTYKQTIGPTGKRYVKVAWQDNFYWRLSDDLYEWYHDLRNSYVDTANKMMEEQLEEKRAKHSFWKNRVLQWQKKQEGLDGKS